MTANPADSAAAVEAARAWHTRFTNLPPYANSPFVAAFVAGAEWAEAAVRADERAQFSGFDLDGLLAMQARLAAAEQVVAAARKSSARFMSDTDSRDFVIAIAVYDAQEQAK